MEKTRFAKVLLNNKIYPIYKINYDTNQVILKESEKVFLTILLKDIKFIYYKEKTSQK